MCGISRQKLRRQKQTSKWQPVDRLHTDLKTSRPRGQYRYTQQGSRESANFKVAVSRQIATDHRRSNLFSAFPVPVHTATPRTFASLYSSVESSTTAAMATISSQPKPKRKRTPTFSEDVAVKLIPNLGELTDQEYVDTYYTHGELRQLKESTMDDIRELRYFCSTKAGLASNANFYGNAHGLTLPPNFCHRGIEHLRSVEANEHRRSTRRTCVRSVLVEQYAQSDGGYADPMALGRVASNASASSRIEAVRKGDADAAEARRVHGIGIKPSGAKKTAGGRLIRPILQRPLLGSIRMQRSTPAVA